MTEKWKPLIIKDECTNYVISTFGNVLNVKTMKFLKTRVNKKGYVEIRLSIRGKSMTKRVHRLVALTFIERDNLDKNEVNHKDCNKLHNCVENLEWTTRLENMDHAKENQRLFKGEDHPMNKYGEHQIIRVCELLSKGMTNKDVYLETGVSVDNIIRIKERKVWAHISENYNIPAPEKRNKHTDKYEYIELLLKMGYSTKKILKMLDFTSNQKYKSLIGHRRNKINKERKGSTTIESIYDVDLCDVYTLEEVSLKIRC